MTATLAPCPDCGITRIHVRGDPCPVAPGNRQGPAPRRTIEPCRAGFAGCDEMRAEDAAKHPRTPRVRECRHLPIPPELPERLRGPEIGTECVYHNKSQRYNGRRVVVIERSYVWAPGEPSYGGGSRRYDWKIVRFLDNGQTLCVDDKDLLPAAMPYA